MRQTLVNVMRSSNSKFITFGLFIAFATSIYLFTKNPAESETTVRQINEVTPTTDLSRQTNSEQIIDLSQSTKSIEVMQQQPSQVPIPTGASSLEKIIENFQQEKKKASEAAHESPFKSLN